MTMFIKLGAFALVSLLTATQQDCLAFAPPRVGMSPAARTQLFMNVEQRETKDVRVGVIGMGRIGLVHLEAINKAPGVRPVIVSNPTISKAEKGKRTKIHSECQSLL